MGLTYISVTIGVAIAVWCAWYCRRLAAEKCRSVVLWTLLGFVLTVVAVPVLVLLPAAREAGAEDAAHGAPSIADGPERAASVDDASEGATSD